MKGTGVSSLEMTWLCLRGGVQNGCVSLSVKREIVSVKRKGWVSLSVK